MFKTCPEYPMYIQVVIHQQKELSPACICNTCIKICIHINELTRNNSHLASESKSKENLMKTFPSDM